ncbi:hypothetical protein CJF31_00009284 [Rutstroemia sp. NJR-2017a BVV2]|nr:hypothetical protein CJF31_00009284 [Rutstroemia sp. NJR-2017a BVV2]
MTSKHKAGYAKICFCGERAAHDNLQYFWVDTCCINKSIPQEHQTAINSMFGWYKRATKCYVYLSDVQVTDKTIDIQAFRTLGEPAFRQSRWFKRGWTLQELLAPASVEFFSKDGKLLGSKVSLKQEIHEITKVPINALDGQQPLYKFSVPERMRWAVGRTTTYKEDKVYCLLGIFGVFLPLIYGEGETNAVLRLREEIQRRQEGRGIESLQDLTVFSPLPFPRNEFFTGRDEQLQALEKFLLSPGHRRMTIYGLGGCGKSALTLEAAYRAQYARYLVLWVPAISQKSFELAYQEIGINLCVPGITNDDADVMRLVKEALNSDIGRNWLMIVDNADDPEVLLSGTGRNQRSPGLFNYLPHSSSGKILFTSRSRKFAEDLTPGSVLELTDLGQAEARQLTFARYLEKLRKILGPINNTGDVRFFADLNDLCVILDDQIELFLTVTGSSLLDAFANTAACYISWRWGQRGMDILNWLSQFLLAARQPRSIKIAHPLRIHGEDKDTEPLCIELQGQLNDKSPESLSKCNVAIRIQWIQGRVEDYYALVADIASQLSWIVAAFKEPPQDRLSFSRAKIEKIRDPFQNDEDRCSNFLIVHEDALDQRLEEENGSCWHQIFEGLNVAVGFPIPHRPGRMRGVELPFSLMTTFAGVGYPVAYERGFVLKGRKNALFPVQTEPDSGTIGEASAIQWHLFRSKMPRLYMEEAKDREPSTLPIKTDISPTKVLDEVKKPKRHFLGLYLDAVVCTGTDRTRADVETACSHKYVELKELRWPIEWSRIVNISVGGGGGGVTGGFGTGFRWRNLTERQMHYNHNPNLEQYLLDTSTNFTLLYNIQTRVAWMLPQICVVMHLLQAWAKRNHPGAKIVYPDLKDMELASLKRIFEVFRTQEAATVAQIDLEHNFKEFSNLLSQLQDNPLLKPAKRNLGRQRRLTGVDFFNLATKSEIYDILSVGIKFQSSGNWPMVLNCNWKDWKLKPHPYRVVTLFCANVDPQPILPQHPVCSTWVPPPTDQDYLVTTIYCLKKLADSYGGDPVKLSRKHVWERGTYGPYDRCQGRSSNRLQNIVEGNGTRDKSMKDVLQIASVHAAIVFGGELDANSQCQCSCAEPQQEPVPPLQPATEPRQPVLLAPAPGQQQPGLSSSQRRPPPPPPPSRRRQQPSQVQAVPGQLRSRASCATSASGTQAQINLERV